MSEHIFGSALQREARVFGAEEVRRRDRSDLVVGVHALRDVIEVNEPTSLRGADGSAAVVANDHHPSAARSCTKIGIQIVCARSGVVIQNACAASAGSKLRPKAYSSIPFKVPPMMTPGMLINWWR